MFKYILPALALMSFAVAISTAAFASPPINQPAPDFEAVDIAGNTIKLSDLQGKNVILEWTNHKCPFVTKHYSSDNMQATQRSAIEQGAVWITIISSAPDHQGHVTSKKAQELADTRGASPSNQILDPSGDIGRLYSAQTTPHMFIIDAKGTLVYKGAIDSKSSPNPATIKGATNYVLAALDDMKDGGKIQNPMTPPYGCSIKYAK